MRFRGFDSHLSGSQISLCLGPHETLRRTRRKEEIRKKKKKRKKLIAMQKPCYMGHISRKMMASLPPLLDSNDDDDDDGDGNSKG